MKKVYIPIISISLILLVAIMLIVACGNKESNQDSDTSISTEMGAQEENVVKTDEEEQDVSESDFRTRSLGNGKCEIVGCSATAKVIRVPETIYGETVVGIGSNAFSVLDAQKIILPDTVEYLAKYAFNTCKKLEEVKLGKGLKKTGLLSFNFCNELRSVTFPEGMEEMTECCFAGCEKLGEVYIPASVTKFGNRIAVDPNVVIVTPAGSAAEANALKYGIPVRNP